MDAAEARPKESEHVAAARTDAANKTDLKLFMRKSLCFRAWIPCDRRREAPLGPLGQPEGRPLSAAPERAPTSRARSAKHFATSLALKKTVSPPRVIGSCLVRAYDRKSGLPERVTTRGPWVPSCRAMTIQISEPALIVRRAERRGLRWPLIRRTASQQNRRAPRQARR